MRILVDYRPALRARTGVGEYIHTLVGAYTARTDDIVTLFTSSWKDRLPPSVAHDLRARLVDRRVPVSVLNYLWHRVEWPNVEMLAGDIDVVHAAHPLLIPPDAPRRSSRFTISIFLLHPERTRAEIRRDYAELTPHHARRADAVITSSAHTKRLLTEHLGVDCRSHLRVPAGRTDLEDARPRTQHTARWLRPLSRHARATKEPRRAARCLRRAAARIATRSATRHRRRRVTRGAAVAATHLARAIEGPHHLQGIHRPRRARGTVRRRTRTRAALLR